MEFHTHLGQTSPYPLGIVIERAEGIYIYDKQGNAYADLISGIAVSSLGHGHPKILRAIHAQVDRHLHTMVYGEFIQDAQMNFAEELLALLPSNLQSVYPVNSGTEAIEAAMKLTKRATVRHELIGFKGSYHGSTQGSMSISYNELKKTNYRPLLPGVTFIALNDWQDLANITEKTAGVFLETVQGDAGVRIPDVAFLQALRERCTATGTLLVFDEIQCGLGRTGRYFAFEHFGVIPDVLVLGKALGGGMPIGALVTSLELMSVFKDHPKLGHITTFGGHPVACSAAAAFLQVLKSEINFDQVVASASIFRSIIGSHPEILEVRNLGLMF